MLDLFVGIKDLYFSPHDYAYSNLNNFNLKREAAREEGVTQEKYFFFPIDNKIYFTLTILQSC